MNKTRVSKTLSFLLRHSPDYIDLNGGWAWADEIIQVLQTKYPGFDAKLLSELVAEDEKMRYSYDRSGLKIRANQGHSVPGVVIEMEEPEPPELLYHGTAKQFLPSIWKEGLKPMSRLFVHLSSDVETARAVGKRHGNPVILAIKARAFVRDGYVLKRSANGVWQALAVPTDYFYVIKTTD